MRHHQPIRLEHVLASHTMIVSLLLISNRARNQRRGSAGAAKAPQPEEGTLVPMAAPILDLDLDVAVAVALGRCRWFGGDTALAQTLAT